MQHGMAQQGLVRLAGRVNGCPTPVLMLALLSWACGPHPVDSPKPAHQRADLPPQLVLPPPPGAAGPRAPVPLSTAEKAAIEQLRRRGASITVFAGSGDVSVHFPLGAEERKWRKQGLPTANCGVSIEYSFSPDDSGPPMTDQDLAYLEQLPKLTRVNLGGTRVTGRALRAFREAHPHISVEDRDDD